MRYRCVRTAGRQGGSPMDDARAIADYLRGIPQATQLIAKGQDDRMDENWTLLSTFERDEIIEESSKSR